MPQSLLTFPWSTWRRELSLPACLARLAGITGFAVSFASTFTPWFSVPVTVLPGETFVSEVPLVSWAYQAASFGVAVGAIGICTHGTDWKSRLGRLYLLWFMALLFFPYFVSVWSPEVAGRASWLQSQHESLTAFTGDIYTSQEYKDSLLRHRVNVVNRPIETEVFLLPDWEPQNFGWNRMIEIVEWFGLSNWFASFLRRGWPLALVGSAAILLALAREAARTGLPKSQCLPPHRGVLFLAAVLVALVAVLGAASCLSVASRYAERGEYASARRLMGWAARCAPVLTQDGYYLMEAGLLANALGLQDPEAAYYRARIAEDAGYQFQARTMYLDGLSMDRLQPALLRESIKGLLRQATNAMNTGDLDSATILLEQVLTNDPPNLKANYSLQLAYLRNGNINGLRSLQHRMANVYKYFNTPLKAAVLANAGENRAAGELLSGNVADALKAWHDAKAP